MARATALTLLLLIAAVLGAAAFTVAPVARRPLSHSLSRPMTPRMQAEEPAPEVAGEPEEAVAAPPAEEPEAPVPPPSLVKNIAIFAVLGAGLFFARGGENLGL